MQLTGAVRTLHLGAAGLALAMVSCQTPREHVSAPPAVSNADYERTQLMALGCIPESTSAGSGRSAVQRSDAGQRAPQVPRSRRPAEWPVPGLPQPRMTDAVNMPTSTLAHPAHLPASQPVQKMGGTYFTPRGGTSQKIGSIMFNSDGSSGTLIGNKIMR